jgi:hypothetical protein
VGVTGRDFAGGVLTGIACTFTAVASVAVARASLSALAGVVGRALRCPSVVRLVLAGQRLRAWRVQFRSGAVHASVVLAALATACAAFTPAFTTAFATLTAAFATGCTLGANFCAFGGQFRHGIAAAFSFAVVTAFAATVAR